ncbi:hypothetical protein VNO77_24469 [Canavalia gladiata]|uniref:Uncharacterized protein n=1 Tax=Canavalia gladiata TaxID=3824 RepID=A0AAN9L9Q9_CANGL
MASSLNCNGMIQMFDGEEAYCWLINIEQYFGAIGTPKEEKLTGLRGSSQAGNELDHVKNQLGICKKRRGERGVGLKLQKLGQPFDLMDQAQTIEAKEWSSQKGGVPDSLASNKPYPAGHATFADILGSLDGVDGHHVGLGAMYLLERNSPLPLMEERFRGTDTLGPHAVWHAQNRGLELGPSSYPSTTTKTSRVKCTPVADRLRAVELQLLLAQLTQLWVQMMSGVARCVLNGGKSTHDGHLGQHSQKLIGYFDSILAAAKIKDTYNPVMVLESNAYILGILKVEYQNNQGKLNLLKNLQITGWPWELMIFSSLTIGGQLKEMYTAAMINPVLLDPVSVDNAK